MGAKLTLFDPYSVDEQAILLASHLPIGAVWRNAFVPNSNLGKLILGLSVEFYRFQQLVNLSATECDIQQADELLVEWEKSVGVPDTCFYTTAKTYAQRRDYVQTKLARFGGVQTADDIERVALFFGLTVTVTPGAVYGGFGSTKEATHSIVISYSSFATTDDFPLPFPIPFSIGGATFLTCILSRLIPANVQLVTV